MQKNEIYEMTADDLTLEGNGVGRIENMAVFVPGLLPGENAKIKIIKVLKSYAIGRIEDLLTPSEDRIEPECKVYKRCGGCSLQHLSYDAQLRFKQKRVTDCIRRIAKSDAKVNDIVACSKKTRYRNKTAFPVRRDESSALRIGCFSLRSHHVVDIDDCLISSEKCAKIIGVIRQFIEQKDISVYDEVSKKGLLRHIVVRESSSGNRIVALVINADDMPNKSEWIESLKPYVDSIALNINKSEGNAILSSKTNVIYGSGAIREHICGLDFDVSINSFLQVNHEQTEKLYSLAMDLADITDEKVVVDLYCGIGTISLLAAKRAKAVYGIEIVPQAIENANKNKQLNGITNAHFICADCAEGFSKIQKQCKVPDVVIVDPPRKGLSKKVIDDICACGTHKIVYISCDPATLARDIQIFCLNGYSLKCVTPVDMFPNTCAVEDVALIEKIRATESTFINE